MNNRKWLIAATAICWSLGAGTVGIAADEQPVKDSWITTKVKAELTKDSETKARDIHVTTKDGVVMASGSVATAAEKEKAEQDARNVKGVVEVRNKIDVK